MGNLRCEGLRKSFDGTHALWDVTLSFPQSGIVAIVGPNGAGKTTLINVLSGFTVPDSGRCFLHGRPITGLAPYLIAGKGITRTFQDLRLNFQMSVLDNALLACPRQLGEHLIYALFGVGVTRQEEKNRQEVLRLLKSVGLEKLARLPAGELSYGQQKLLTLACCLAMGGPILLLDEPVAGVHETIADQVLAFIRTLPDQRKLVVFIEHDMSAVRKIADYVIVMDGGVVIAQGPPGEVLERSDILEVYLG